MVECWKDGRMEGYIHTHLIIHAFTHLIISNVVKVKRIKN